MTDTRKVQNWLNEQMPDADNTTPRHILKVRRALVAALRKCDELWNSDTTHTPVGETSPDLAKEFDTGVRFAAEDIRAIILEKLGLPPKSDSSLPRE